MPTIAVNRVLDPTPTRSLKAHIDAGGGRGLDAARLLGPASTLEQIDASGLRGRGGSGFPTARKWRSILDNASAVLPPTVVVNAAEGEPGTFKDRAILRANPYRVIEGALIAAHTVGSDRVVLAIKASFTQELARVRGAIAEIEAAGWANDVDILVVEGPGEYLFGEETGLLEVIDGRPPFPRVAPPYRHGVDEIAVGTEVATAGAGDDTIGPPTLVNNVETLANVPGLLVEGAEWFRSVGTDASPGTVVVTITGDVPRHGVLEVPMGTRLSAVIAEVGGPLGKGRCLVAAMSGVANPLLTAAQLDIGLSYEHMEAAGTGLGAAGFIVFDDTTDLASVAAAVSRFLAVESCGQCTPCKQDGLAIADLFDRVRRSAGEAGDLDSLGDLLGTVADGARCYLATQQQRVGQSILQQVPDAVAVHLDGRAGAAERVLIAPVVDIVDDRAVLDEGHEAKQPDWTFDEVDSGQSPADRIDVAKGETD